MKLTKKLNYIKKKVLTIQITKKHQYLYYDFI